MIERCRSRYLKQENLENSELLRLLSQTGKKSNEEHLSYEVFEETTAARAGGGKEAQTPTSAAPPAGIHGSSPQISPQGSVSGKNSPLPLSDFRIVLLGKSDDKKTKLGNFIIGHQGFQHYKHSPTRHFGASWGEWRGKSVTVVKTPDMFSLSEKNMRREVKSCVSLCPPGTNVLLLLVKPSDFTEENRETLKFILSLFGRDVFECSVVVITRDDERSLSVTELLRDCGGRRYEMFQDGHNQLMGQIERIVDGTRGTFLTFTEETIKPKPQLMNRALNLVLCCRRGAEKTSAVEAISDAAALPSHWDDMKGDIMKLFPVAQGSKEYNHVEAELTKTGLTANIISIERVQNTTLWQSYQLMKKQMEVKNKQANNERLLFHGTKSQAIDLINKQGFNRSYAGEHGAMYGNGSYFAVDPVYSAQSYATQDTNGHKRMYQARVLVGDSIQGYQGFIAPPSKSSTSAADLYDSVSDNTTNPTMFVIFNDIQAYPEYLITFI